ncbi:cystathionine gamma-lyase [Exophiala aquamarina CBS 119918]|uniref:cystathionine gamma-lyase n=1 Tax=Exophiala aquamarina CBS 119918 TaxID=1182545 RepID=A0A072PVZ0_9EURO|nr:cystathionine gamma-lyase [Exophiala aquamarina CBS 119918]KEF63523.1 cystathionine gamma-lyase [Exophiala aquamarina CBS 119918]
MTVPLSPRPLRPDERILTNEDGGIDTPARAPSPVHNFGTLAVHAGSPHDPYTGAVIEPLSLSTTFAQTAVGKPVGLYEYSRSSNPNRDNFEEAVAALEHARYALAFASGSATTATILQSLAAGSHVISVSDVYGGTHRYFTKVALAHGVEVTFSPSIELDIEELIREQTKLIWIESPSNPTLSLVDIRQVATTAHKHGILVVVDNTFLSPYVQNPLDHGADIVIHSVTKYINGHSDVVMGVAAFNSDELKERLTFLQNAIGAVPSPFDCWLAHRGLKTLHLRAREASVNAMTVASALEASPNVLAVNYPGLASHKQRAIAIKQHRNGMGGGMLSFRIKGGHAAAERFCQSTKIFTLAESLGGVESLCEVPSAMTHAGIPQQQREAIGVFDDLIRLSCGVEDAADLRKDVLQAVEKAVVGPKINNALNGAPSGHRSNGATVSRR